jgi:phosphate:Na+ symporter
MVRFLEKAVPSRGVEKTRLTDLDVHMLDTPVLAIAQSQNEILKMGRACEEMLEQLLALLQQDEPDAETVRGIHRSEETLDAMQDEVSHFVTGLLAHNVPHSVAEEARGQLRMADEYESVSDYVASILKFDLKLRKDGLRFTESQRAELAQLHQSTVDYLKSVNLANRQRNRKIVKDIKSANKQLRGMVKRLRQEHLVQLSSHAIAPAVSVAFLAALNSYTRVRDHALNIAEVIAGQK